jgi:hypothetical protein
MDPRTSISGKDFHDINSEDNLSELRVLQEIISEDSGTAVQALQFLKSL